MAFEKKILNEGSPDLQRPNWLCSVLVDVLGSWTSPGGDVTFQREENITINLDDAHDGVSAAVEDMICTMRPGEVSQFRLQDVDSSQVRPCTVPMETHVSYKLRLLSVISCGKDVWRLTDQERLEIAQKHKDKGSELFKIKNYQGASIHYSKAIKYLAALDTNAPYGRAPTLEEHERNIAKVRIMSLLNLSACQLHLDQHNHVVSNCSKVLEVEPTNMKGLYRRAKALLAMKDFEAAREDLVKVKGVEPGNQATNELMKMLDNQEIAHRAKYKDALKGMFR